MYARDHGQIATPIGIVRIEADGDALISVTLPGQGVPSRPTSVLVSDAAVQIEQWFAGERTTFDLALSPAATQRGSALRNAIIAIPYGDVQSYGDLSRRAMSSPRAVGQACARNPFPIIVPCHRVLASGGALGAYSAGAGPSTKRWLIDHECRHANPLIRSRLL